MCQFQVGIGGQDINEGNVTLTLALIWQLMRAYTLSILSQLHESGSPIVEKEIVNWANAKLASAGKKTSIRNFQDPSIADAKVIIDLIDAIRPGAINYDLVKTGGTEEVSISVLTSLTFIQYIFRTKLTMTNDIKGQCEAESY